jgi:N-acetyl-1-D-myo-inositol-2-amino-2-deoxy-alpha-D-glucopyranoside deacetylase
LLCVVAHPDDETFGCGGTLAKYAGEGVRVALICGTLGEVGEISDPSLASQDNLGEIREQELRAAADALGVSDLFILGYRDSGMAGTPDNDHPNAFSGANRDDIVREVVRVIRQLNPQVVITFDPKGGYGHPDHIMAHKAAVEAFRAAADANRFPEQLAGGLHPYQPEKLYYFGFTQSMVKRFQEAIREAGMETDLEQLDPEEFGMPDEAVTTVLDVRAYGHKKEKAAAQHRTQIQGPDPFAWLPGDMKEAFLSTEYLMRAEPPTTPGEPEETDLFAGIDT